MNERSSRKRRGDKWYAVGTSQVNVQQGGALSVHAVGGSDQQLREPANAAQAGIMLSEAKRVNKQYGQSLSREYLEDPTLLMQLYLALVSLLVKWGQFQPALFIATVKSRSTYYYGKERHLLHNGMVYHRAKPSPTLLPSDAEESWKILFATHQDVHSAGDGSVSAQGSDQSIFGPHGPPPVPAEAAQSSSTAPAPPASGVDVSTTESAHQAAREPLPPSPPPSEGSADFRLPSFTDIHDNNPRRETNFFDPRENSLDWCPERVQVADALSQQADAMLLWIIDNPHTFVGRAFRKHQDKLCQDREPVGIITALVFVHSLISSAMRETNLQNVMKRRLDDFMWTSGCTDFWKVWLEFVESVSIFEDVTGVTYNKYGQFVVALKEEFDMLRITKKGSGAHAWDHLSAQFKALHGVHYVIIESWSKGEAEAFVEKVQDLQSKETSDGAGNRKIANRKLAGSSQASGTFPLVIDGAFQTDEVDAQGNPPMAAHFGSQLHALIHGSRPAASSSPAPAPSPTPVGQAIAGPAASPVEVWAGHVIPVLLLHPPLHRRLHLCRHAPSGTTVFATLS